MAGRAPAFVSPASPLFADEFAPRPAVSGGEKEQELSAPATMTATVPANAEIWVDGKKTKQDGALRLYITPPFMRGSTYASDVGVHSTTADGTIVDLTRNVTVRAGLETNIAAL